MPGPIYHVGNTTMCPHGGQVQDIPTAPRVTVSMMPVGVIGDIGPIAACPFMLATVPHPCVLANWIVPATRVFAMGRPVLLQTAIGLCVAPDQAPQGPPVVAVNQMRAIAM
jgi:hypothetical protein